MAAEAKGAANWFASGGRDYARFRPEYPPALAAHLAALAPSTRLALDMGCGTGQLTVRLADHFTRVIGVDPGAGQIANAPPHPRIGYICAPAESVPLDKAGAGLIAAAQAAHWFDRPAFWAEARRLAAPDAVIALISYGMPSLSDTGLNRRFARFYHQEIGPFWPPERRLVDSGYADMDFPFAELPAPKLSIRRLWDLAGFLGYISTWSAIRQAREAGRDEIFIAFARDLAALWGNPVRRRRVTWPLNMRIGRI